MLEIVQGLAIPLLGTTLGAAVVFLMRGEPNHMVQRALTGFAAGVMVAASVWSLIVPAIDGAAAQGMGQLSFLPALIGFWLGTLLLLLLDHVVPHLHMGEQDECPEGIDCNLGKSSLMVMAVALHNLPEGMAVGVVYAGWMTGQTDITFAAALALSIGIAIQNFPEGAIVSLPLHAQGESKGKAFSKGFLSGLIEPAGAVVTILFASHFIPIMPYLLSFAAGAMMYVVVEELIPEMSEGKHSNIGVIMFAVGFTLMMALDVALG